MKGELCIWHCVTLTLFPIFRSVCLGAFSASHPFILNIQLLLYHERRIFRDEIFQAFQALDLFPKSLTWDTWHSLGKSLLTAYRYKVLRICSFKVAESTSICPHIIMFGQLGSVSFYVPVASTGTNKSSKFPLFTVYVVSSPLWNLTHKHDCREEQPICWIATRNWQANSRCLQILLT